MLRLAAMGLTTRQIADRLFVSPKAAEHHIQHAYTKIDVSTRAAAALWAMQHELVLGDHLASHRGNRNQGRTRFEGAVTGPAPRQRDGRGIRPDDPRPA